MGLADWKSWLVILVVVALVFGTKKLANIGSDLGQALRSFKKAFNEEESKADLKTDNPVKTESN